MSFEALEMKKSSSASAGRRPAVQSAGNGHVAMAEPGENGKQPSPPALETILTALQTVRDGDFSVRLPVVWTGLEGKIADTFNEIVAANEMMARELNRVGLA